MKTIIEMVAVCFFIIGFVGTIGTKTCNCPGGWVNIGEHKQRILDRCGSPDKVLFQGADKENGKTKIRTSEDWVYQNLGGGMVRIFSFRGNQLVGITKYRK